jgi:hypothetical protein
MDTPKENALNEKVGIFLVQSCCAVSLFVAAWIVVSPWARACFSAVGIALVVWAFRRWRTKPPFVNDVKRRGPNTDASS